jgi:hypothetical protein
VGYNSISVSHLSLQYVSVPLTVTTLDGAPYNPTSDVVQMAFMPTATQVPQSGDWVAAVWSTDPSNLIYPYAANCLIGPGGTITLGIGTYIIYVRVTDNPEVPVEIAPLQLQIF